MNHLLSFLERRRLSIELCIVLMLTYGFSALSATLQLANSLSRNLNSQEIILNPRYSHNNLIDCGWNIIFIVQLIAWGSLGVYLLWSHNNDLTIAGLNRSPKWIDLINSIFLSICIGVPGLFWYLIAHSHNLNLTIIPASTYTTLWHIPLLITMAFANGWSEEVIVVGYLLIRLSQLRVKPYKALIFSAVLRGSYHLYQGFGGALGNIAMGLVFGLFWQRSHRLWSLIIAHGIIDTVAFVGYIILGQYIHWLS